MMRTVATLWLIVALAAAATAQDSQIRDAGKGFPALDHPAVVAAGQAHFLAPDDMVLGMTVGTASRAYPIAIVTHHHVCNDVLGGRPILVTY